MIRMLVLNVIAAPFALLLLTAPAAAFPEDQDVFTDFEGVFPNTLPGVIIVVGVSPASADLGGDAFGGRVGAPALYRSGFRSWMVQANGTGVISFESDADVVEFYVRVLLSATGNTVITAFDHCIRCVGCHRRWPGDRTTEYDMATRLALRGHR